MDQVSKIVLKSLGDPSIIKQDEHKDKQEIVLGRIIGLMSGVAKRKDATGEKFYYGLQGDFVAQPNQEISKRDPLRSNICYLPDFAQDPLVSLYYSEANRETGAMKEVPDDAKPKGPVKVAVNVIVIRAANPQGYSWKLSPILEAKAMEQADPLLALMTEVDGAKGGQKAIEAPAKKK